MVFSYVSMSIEPMESYGRGVGGGTGWPLGQWGGHWPRRAEAGARHEAAATSARTKRGVIGAGVL